MKYLVLGAGRMGYAVAFDLSRSPDTEEVTLADIDLDRARAACERLGTPEVRPSRVDVENKREVVKLLEGHDSAVGCVAYKYNVDLSEAAIEARVNYCDLGGNNSIVDGQLELDGPAREAGVNIIPDCGLAPGMVSMLVAHAAARFESLDEIHIRVGGLPLNPEPPLDYQLVFSVEGLINEYVEPARVIRDGVITEVESMTEIEDIDFPAPFHGLEAFQTSGGTSTLPQTFEGKVHQLDYKTIRYRGHCEKFRLLIDLGLASSDPVSVDGVEIAPRRVLGRVLEEVLPRDQPDVVLIRVEVSGIRERDKRTLRYDVVDHHDPATGLSAMMRTTGFPAAIVARMMARGEVRSRGALPQERCLDPGVFIQELAGRNIDLIESWR